MIDFAQTKTHCSSSILLLAVLLGGCGEVAYKRGASSSDLQAAKKSCREKGPDPAAVEKCMADRGWVVQNLNRMEPLETDPVVDASAIPSDRQIENETSAAPDAQRAESPAAAAIRKPDMLDTFKVSSWWKAGSGADSLKSDMEECVVKLGEAHRPVQTPHTQKATRGLLLCMKEKGWSALRAK